MRSEDHFEDNRRAGGAEPKLVSLEDASVEELKLAFEGANGVLFAAGAGGKGGKERTVKVDQEGAIKVFDAIDKVDGEKPKLVLVSALDTRDVSKPAPSHYVESIGPSR